MKTLEHIHEQAAYVLKATVKKQLFTIINYCYFIHPSDTKSYKPKRDTYSGIKYIHAYKVCRSKS